VEHYERSFSLHNPGGINYINVNSASKITTGMRLFLGPSNDADNEGAGEYVTVSYRSGNTVYLTSNLVYQYVIGDQVSFYNNVYLISELGIGGDTSRGTIFKINADSGSVMELNNEKVYQNISSARWCILSETIASISSNNMFFINPYASYYNWKSMCLNNLEDNNSDIISYHDVLFDDYEVYFLANKKLIRGDDYGTNTLENWGSWYNYIQNTLLPYSNTIIVYCDDSVLIGQTISTTIYVKVVDQFGVGLSGKTVNFYIISGDIAAEFTPTNGQVTTDINGEASIIYTSGFTYEGDTFLTCKTDGSSSYTGSQYIWNSIRIYNTINASGEGKLDAWAIEFEGAVRLKDIETEMESEYSMFGKTFFTNPGGEWYQNPNTAGSVQTYIPGLIVGDGEGPPYSFSAPDLPISQPDQWNPMPNNLRQVEDFESLKGLRQFKNFKCLTEYSIGDGKFLYEEPYSIVQQIIESFDLQLSQLKVSGHTHWIGSEDYDYLWTYVTLDQFIFVEDAIPAFWSIKNPRETNIWIRLRPFAYSLDATRFSFFVREVWYDGDTGYVDVTSQVSYQYFDAGGGILGLELTYDPTENFHYNAVVYVFIQIYDTAPFPNRITTNYYFSVIPDYKSPYLENLSPSREQSNVAVDTDVYFEIKDEGAGVDIDTLEVFINSRVVTPTSIEKVTDAHYKITYNPSTNFFYGKRVSVGVIVDDLSDNENWLNDRYAFYTADSEGVYFTNFEPEMCKRGLSRFHDVSFVALGLGEGVDVSTLRLQVRDKDVTDQSDIVPIIYRIS